MKITIEFRDDISREIGGKKFYLQNELGDMLFCALDDWHVKAVAIDGVPMSDDAERKLRDVVRDYDLTINGESGEDLTEAPMTKEDWQEYNAEIAIDER